MRKERRRFASKLLFLRFFKSWLSSNLRDSIGY
uniref:Uncharacterized protein n=1 Tax=Rhizophora mucronata TaxID=61149 RepID=A0A2P2MNZ1_RHIMU